MEGEMVSSPFIVRRERKSTKPSKIQRGALLALPAITDISFGAIVPLNVLSPRSSYPPARFGKPMAEYSSSHFVTNMTEIRTCHGKVYPAYLSEIALQMQGQRFADGEDTPCIIGLLFIPSLPYVSFTMKGKGSERCRFSFGKMRHCFIGTASLHSHHKVDDASTLVCAVIMPQVLPKVHFQAGIVVFSVRCVIKSIAVVPFGRFNTTGVQVVAYRYLFDML